MSEPREGARVTCQGRVLRQAFPLPMKNVDTLWDKSEKEVVSLK